MIIDFNYLSFEEKEKIVSKLSDEWMKKIKSEYLDIEKLKEKLRAALNDLPPSFGESDTITIILRTNLTADYFFFEEILLKIRKKAVSSKKTQKNKK